MSPPGGGLHRALSPPGDRASARTGLAVAALALHAAALGFRAAVALAGARAPAPAAGAVPAPLPMFTVLGAMRGEGAWVEHWLRQMARLRYPRERLEVILLVDHDDPETRAAAAAALRAAGEPGWARLEVVPPGGPRTKPRALQHGLALARGEIITVYDAEDRPDPGQLLAAAAGFAAAPPEVACLQARLVVDDPSPRALVRLTAAEYAVWHGGVLPGLARLGGPVPLAGTSNHLRVAALRAVGGWDPGNVTEDAELGVRLAASGRRTLRLASVTREGAVPPGARAWMRQRARWSKGFCLTWWRYARPGGEGRALGTGRRALMHGTLGGTVLLQLTAALLWVPPVLGAAGRLAPSRRWRPPSPASRVAATGIVAAGAARLLLGVAFPGPRPRPRDVVFAPVHALLEGLAAWRGLAGALTDPRRWDRTDHGVPPAGGD